MTRLPWLLILVAAAAPARPQDMELLYEAPSDLSIPQLKEAAKALAARCRDSGLKGVSAVPDLKGMKRVRVTCPAGSGDSAAARIDFLATFPAARIQLRLFHKLTAEEEEKFPVGQSAPPGDSWVELPEWERVEIPFVAYRKSAAPPQLWLLRKQPILDVSTKLKVLRHEGGPYYQSKLEPGLYLEFPKDITKPLFEAVADNPEKPGKPALFIEIIIDGARMPTGGGMMGWADTREKREKIPDLALWSIKELSESTVLPALLQHRLPAALKRVD
jgi:hypothetical protein